jgi:hypothetical protein
MHTVKSLHEFIHDHQPDEAKAFLTPEYGFSLASNFRPDDDCRADIRAVHQPMEVLVD